VVIRKYKVMIYLVGRWRL